MALTNLDEELLTLLTDTFLLSLTGMINSVKKFSPLAKKIYDSPPLG